jgi:hypothetical protein
VTTIFLPYSFIFVGDTHEILVELEGMGGGGEVWLEVCFFQWNKNKPTIQALNMRKNYQHVYFGEQHDACHLFVYILVDKIMYVYLRS